MYPIRVLPTNVRGCGAAWTPFRYVPHIPKVAGNGKNYRARLAVSDARRDMEQRCLAMVLSPLAEASEHCVRVEIPRFRNFLLVPRVKGVVVDQTEERGVLGLMGSQVTFSCTHCVLRRLEFCNFEGDLGLTRLVIDTLKTQLRAAEMRVAGRRDAGRSGLSEAMSSLPFVPALGAVHGLATGAVNLYNVVSFDTPHLSKLGALRPKAQRLPMVLQTVCGSGMALQGTVHNTLDAVSLRGFELGRLCQASSTSPGYVVDTP